MRVLLACECSGAVRDAAWAAGAAAWAAARAAAWAAARDAQENQLRQMLAASEATLTAV